MLTRLANIDKVSILATGLRIATEEGVNTISALASKLGVPLMSENRNRSDLLDRITATPAKTPLTAESEAEAVARSLISFLCERSGAVTTNTARSTYAPWFKDHVLQLRDGGVSYRTIVELTGISEDTLTGFRSQASALMDKVPIDGASRLIAAIWTEAPPRYRKNLDTFWYYLGKKHPDVRISSKELRQTLINLGLRYPRGPKIKNIGTQVKRPFQPHALWEGDGKQISITINGREHLYCWYAFVDQNTTLLVGSAIAKTESSTAFLAALKNGRERTGTFAIGVLIDNRLSDEDLSPIADFCKDHDIVLVRTFPGNAKSNGNIENNFSLFESLVGPVSLSGTPEQVARQVATLVIEIFTGLRNNSRRPRLNGKTPAEAAQQANRPENTRSAVERLASRLDREIKDIDFKWELIKGAREHFGDLSPASELKIMGLLGKYPVMDIIAAQAAYLAQITKYPERWYGSEYFMAILRHKRETLAKRTYNESYRAAIVSVLHLGTAYDKPIGQYAALIINELSRLPDLKTPAERMLHLDALSWWLLGFSSKKPIRELWRLIGEMAETARAISLRWWQAINEYVSERIGALLYLDFAAVAFGHSHRISGVSVAEIGH